MAKTGQMNRKGRELGRFWGEQTRGKAPETPGDLE